MNARIVLVAVAALALGLGSRALPIGAIVWDKYAGDAAYAAMVFVVLAALRCRRAAPIAFVLCAAIEALQATGLPLQWSRSMPPLRWLLGTTFGWFDFVAYAFGVGAAWCAVGGTQRDASPAQ